MKTDRPFFDTNVLLYLLSEDNRKADRAEAIIASGGIISVQVLNEFASVASRKLGMSYAEIRDVLGAVRAVCQTQAVTVDTHDRGAGYCGTIRFFFVRQYDRQLSASIRL
ncbi:MAG TPA: PIN domain-containing protein [Methylobacter sp.]